MKKFYIKTFGCRLNQYQSEKIREWLSACNLLPARTPDEADLVIVNGCVVTHRGERDTRKYILKYSRRGKQVVATGCYINLPYVSPPPNTSFLTVEEIKKSFSLVSEPKAIQSRHRILIGIQEGCNFRCTYCIVPFVRGRARDRKKEEILTEIETYVEKGVKEIVITGTEIGGYGKKSNSNLASLIREIKKKFPELKIRLSSILPLYVTDDIILLFKDNIVLPHVHLPLQSGSKKVLKEMKRPYKLERFLWAFEKLYETHPHMAIGTDIIVGYPTETDEDFEMTYELIKKLPFAYVHVFLYSRRPFTEAFTIKELPYEIIKKREQRLLELVKHKKKAFIEKFTDRTLMAMVEKIQGDMASGTTENYIKFVAKSTNKVHAGSYVQIRVLYSENYRAVSEILKLL